MRCAAEKLGVPLGVACGRRLGGRHPGRPGSGRRAAGVLTGFGSRADLERAGADLIFASVVQLKDWM